MAKFLYPFTSNKLHFYKSGRKVRIAELPQKPIIVTQYNRHVWCCGHCQQEHTASLPDEIKRKNVANYGKRLLRYTKSMFMTIHRRAELTPLSYKRLMYHHKRQFLRMVRWGVPDDAERRNIAKQFDDFSQEYFLFIDTEILSTNNLAEQSIR